MYTYLILGCRNLHLQIKISKLISAILLHLLMPFWAVVNLFLEIIYGTKLQDHFQK